MWINHKDSYEKEFNVKELNKYESAESKCQVDEELISKKNALNLFISRILLSKSSGTFETLSLIHEMIFRNVFDFAGVIRKVNIVKDYFSFAPVLFLENSLSNIEKIPQETFNQVIEK